MDLESIANSLRRRAIRLDVGQGRPRSDEIVTASRFGCVKLALPGETWPYYDGRPMLPLSQINLTEMPFRPPGFEDLEFITVFIDAEKLPSHAPNGQSWCLRAYADFAQLVPLTTPPDHVTPVKSGYLYPTVVEDDYPNWEDVDIEIADEIADNYYDHFQNVSGFKLGGWPTLIQSEIYWAPWNQHPSEPRYVFQIDSEPECGWNWADAGVGYFGRGTAPGHSNEWAFEWQCY